MVALAKYLRFSDHNIRVVGHTDNREYSSVTYPSAWELSLARAQTILVNLTRQGVPESRMSLVGYGPARPRFDNISRLGRARNRRVEIVILNGSENP